MNLHIFNPEHDIALAYDVPHIKVSHAAQELRMNLGFLPALWAKDGDCVLVDDIKFALKASSNLKKLKTDVLFVEKSDLKKLPIVDVLPWGWDKRVVAELRENGVTEELLPNADELSEIRTLSGRQQTTAALHHIRKGIESQTCGESYVCDALTDIDSLVSEYENIVVKAPWSSSGRGIRYVNSVMDTAKRSWVEKTILRQGCVTAEPYYNKVCDFAMEFFANAAGSIEYSGLSVFHTLNGKYTGNIIADEEYKLARLERYISDRLFENVKNRCLEYFSIIMKGKYSGPFGVDMMVVADKSTGTLLLHPCVEINLRRTMGHVALSLSKRNFEFASMMSINHVVNYQFHVNRIEGDFVQVV